MGTFCFSFPFQKHFNFVSKFQHFDIMCIMLECGAEKKEITKKHTIYREYQQKRKTVGFKGRKLFERAKNYSHLFVFQQLQNHKFHNSTKQSEREVQDFTTMTMAE
jgi:hypothetical protein